MELTAKLRQALLLLCALMPLFVCVPAFGIVAEGVPQYYEDAGVHRFTLTGFSPQEVWEQGYRAPSRWVTKYTPIFTSDTGHQFEYRPSFSFVEQQNLQKRDITIDRRVLLDGEETVCVSPLFSVEGYALYRWVGYILSWAVLALFPLVLLPWAILQTRRYLKHRKRLAELTKQHKRDLEQELFGALPNAMKQPKTSRKERHQVSAKTNEFIRRLKEEAPLDPCLTDDNTPPLCLMIPFGALLAACLFIALPAFFGHIPVFFASGMVVSVGIVSVLGSLVGFAALLLLAVVIFRKQPGSESALQSILLALAIQIVPLVTWLMSLRR